MRAKNCFIATVLCMVIFVICALSDFYLCAILSLLSAFVFFTFGIYKHKDEQIRQEYAEFADMSQFVIGMTKEDVEKLNSKYIKMRIDETNASLSGICETCGGKVVNGVCTYCGNVYDDNSKISYLNYATRYGERQFTFNGQNLIKTKIYLNSIEKFL